ncbi:hypothetical protein ACN9ML_03930 [Dyadobacter endophyticus]|uniref:hypothetical protein n=1 Tax=Dyadobacter TaxID=120831 RepID=UPI003CEA6EFD
MSWNYPRKVFPFEPAELKRPKNSTWYVQYYVYSDKDQKLKRRKKLVQGATQKDRKESARIMIQEINTVLKSGGHIDPVKKLREIGQMPLVVALDQFMADKKRTLKPQSVSTYEKWTNYFLDFLEAFDLMIINIQDFDNENAADLRTHALESLNMAPYTIHFLLPAFPKQKVL